jgi:acyl-CoA thioester hydrolase
MIYKRNILKLRLDWSEMDLFGHINNVSFFKYVQSSRVNFWESRGYNKLFDREKKGPLLAACSCKFIRPLFYPGEIEIGIKTSFVKTTSFGLHHRIFNNDGEVAAEAEDVVVFFDYNKNEKLTIPDEFRKALLDQMFDD